LLMGMRGPVYRTLGGKGDPIWARNPGDVLYKGISRAPRSVEQVKGTTAAGEETSTWSNISRHYKLQAEIEKSALGNLYKSLPEAEQAEFRKNWA